MSWITYISELIIYNSCVNFNYFERNLVHTEGNNQQEWIWHNFKTRFVSGFIKKHKQGRKKWEVDENLTCGSWYMSNTPAYIYTQVYKHINMSELYFGSQSNKFTFSLE